jgi:hypothetical protein
MHPRQRLAAHDDRRFGGGQLVEPGHYFGLRGEVFG